MRFRRAKTITNCFVFCRTIKGLTEPPVYELEARRRVVWFMKEENERRRIRDLFTHYMKCVLNIQMRWRGHISLMKLKFNELKQIWDDEATKLSYLFVTSNLSHNTELFLRLRYLDEPTKTQALKLQFLKAKNAHAVAFARYI